MKANILIAVGAIFILTACESEREKRAEKSAKEFNQYVDSVRRANHTYSNDQWLVIDEGYRAREQRLNAEMEAIREEEKAKLDKSRKDYQELRAQYEAEMKKKDAEMAAINSNQGLRDALFGAGNVNADMQFNFVTAQNIRSIYETFVNTVDANKDSYSREDWDEIKVLYEALDTRKNEVEKELTSKDNMAIAGLKVRFATMNAVNRPGAKVDENMDAKK